MQPPSTDPAAVEWLPALGEIATAATAAGTFAAVAVALWVAMRNTQLQRAEQADRDAGQARLIIASLHRADGRWWVRTTNHSMAPVFAVEVVEVRHGDGVSRLEPVPGAPVELPKLAPGDTIDRAVAFAGDPSYAVVVFQFLDAAGLRWHREGTAQPRRILR